MKRRVLIQHADEPVNEVRQDLTGSAPPLDATGSAAGLTHEWHLQTAYYSANIPIWIDEIADLEQWQAEFMKPEAGEVVAAVGAWIYCFISGPDGSISAEDEKALAGIQEIVEHHSNYGSDVLRLAVAKPVRKAESEEERNQDDEDDKCLALGFEYINYAATGTNDFGEKVGLERLREVLETNEWTAASEDDDQGVEEFDFDEADDDFNGFRREEAEMTAEFYGIQSALHGDDTPGLDAEDADTPQIHGSQVDGLDRMMGKLLAVREQSADLPSDQRKRVAAKAVREIMQEHPDL